MKISTDQVYEARLFRLNKSKNGEVITSVEDAVDMQKKKSALNQFYWNLSRDDKSSAFSASDYEDNGKKRNVGETVTVSCIICYIKSYVFLGCSELVELVYRILVFCHCVPMSFHNSRVLC